MKKGVFNLDLSENNQTNSIPPLLSLPPELFPWISRHLSPVDLAHFVASCQSMLQNEIPIKESLSEEQVKKYHPYISPSKPFFPNFVNRFKELQRKYKILSAPGRFFALALEGKLKYRPEGIPNVDTRTLANIYIISLEMAARQNNMEVVKNLSTIKLIHQHAPYAQLHAICGAAKHNHLEIVKYLLTLPGIDPVTGRHLDRSHIALSHAVGGNGDLEMVKYLLATTDDHDNMAELSSLAAGRGHMEILKYLLDLPGGITDDAKGEMLFAAAGEGHIEVVMHLLALPGITDDDAKGRALITAAGNGHMEVVEYLLPLNGIPDSHKGSALWNAARNGRIEMVKHLLHLPDILANVDKGEMLSSTANNGHLEILEYLLGLPGIAPYFQPPLIGQALNNAADNGHMAMLKYLLPLSPENPYFRKGAALFNAAARGHKEMVEYLLALPDITDAIKGEALVATAKSGHLEIVKCLLRLPNIADTYKDKALVCAAEHGDMAMLNYLLPLQGISIDAKGKALISAASNGQLLMVKKLLTLREISDRDKVQAIEEANKGQYKDTAAVIEKNQRKEVITALGKHLQNRLMHTDKPRWKLAGSIAGAFIGLTAGLLFKVPLLIILSGMIVSGYVGYSLSQKLFERYQARLHKAASLYKDLPRTIDPEEAEALKMGLEARTWRGYFTSFGKKPTYEHPAAFNAGMVFATENSEEAIKKIKAYLS